MNSHALVRDKQAQYIFAHDVVAELITCGDTEIAAIDIRSTIGRLSCLNDDGLSGFAQQFMVYIALIFIYNV